ncbi:MAG TPA: ATP-binding protein [Caulobacteraceae bacterium]|jgi:signal transduction histidine kinase/AmiR/NasT family two-component response regulator
MFGRSLTTRLVGVIATVTGACVVMVATAVGWASYQNEERHAVMEARASSVFLSTIMSEQIARAPGQDARTGDLTMLLDDVPARLGRTILDPAQQFALVSPSGTIVASNDAALLQKSSAALALDGEAKGALSRGEPAITHWRGASALVVSKDLTFAGIDGRWKLYVASPTVVALANARNMALSALLFGCVSIVLAMLIAWRVGRALSKPVVEMAQTMRRMADGDLDVRTPAARATSEVEGMSQALEAFRANARDLLEAETARRAAEKAARDRSEFLAVMSHEIRTPMNGVLGMADALGHTDLDPGQREMLGILNTSGSTLLALLNDILDYSKIEAGRIELEAIPLDISRIVQEVAELFRPQAQGKGLALTAVVPPEAPICLGDPARVRQILHNLVANAVKFTHEGSIRVAVGVRPDGGEATELLVEVADTGIGISPEVQSRLFQKFVQGDASTTRAYGGTGLGLAISRELAQLMGGDITVRSRPGHGAAFTFRVKLPHAEAAPAAEAAGQPAADEAPSLSSLRILAAEDNPNNRQVLQIMLDMVGAQVTFAENGEEAVRQWSQRSFDVILMDVQMPLMDGMEATREIRARERAEGRPRVPIIGVTANAMPHHVTACAEAGMDAHVSKPIRPAALVEALSDALSGARHRDAPAADVA